MAIYLILNGLLIRLGRLRAQSGSEQLQQVVSKTHDPPFRRDFFQTPHREAPQAPDCFDLSEHRLYHRFAHFVDCFSGRRS